MDYKVIYSNWLSSDVLTDEQKRMLRNMSEDEKKDSFYKSIDFGTGGIRGVLGLGTNRLNEYNIRRINYGFAQYLVDSVDKVKTKGIVIAHDNRHMSREFAIESAKVLNYFGIKVYLFPELAPTPQLSFAVRYLEASGGIVITASHNPPQYNGYKLYNEHGCQLVPRESDLVKQYIAKCPDALDLRMDSQIKENIEILGDDVDNAFVQMVASLKLQYDIDPSKLSIVFSPQHGTSYKLTKRLLTEEGYSLTLVEEQCSPDPDFSNTKSPNPEDALAYELPIKYAKKVDADIIVTTDPDADRVGVACKDINGEYQLLTGNQSGALLLDYLIKQKVVDSTQVYAVTTTVTSDFGRAICEKNNIPLHLVHTGFKFIGDVIHQHEINKTNKKFLFGYEESYGYLLDDSVRDKDALQSVYAVCEMANYYKAQGRSLLGVLDKLYDEYGYYMDTLHSFRMAGASGMEKIADIMGTLRAQPLNTIGGIAVKEMQDFSKKIMGLPKANVIKYFLEDGSFVAFHPSGTEPKFKVYCCINANDKDIAKKKHKAMYGDIDRIING